MTKPTDDEVAEVAAELRDLLKHPQLDGRGVDVEAAARVLLDRDLRVPGWEAPRVLPPGWHEPLTALRGPDGTTTYEHYAMRLRAILSCSIAADGRAWLHLSVSHRERVPSWGELGIAKRAFLGDRYAYQVMPPEAKYVNINPRVLHLWALYDEKAEQPLPDFTRGTGTI